MQMCVRKQLISLGGGGGAGVGDCTQGHISTRSSLGALHTSIHLPRKKSNSLEFFYTHSQCSVSNHTRKSGISNCAEEHPRVSRTFRRIGP